MAAFLLFILLIIGIVLIILDVRNIVKWRKEKKRKLMKLKEDPALEQLVNALNETSMSNKKDSNVDLFKELDFNIKEDKEDD